MARTKKQTPITLYASALVQGQTASGVFGSFDDSELGMMTGGSECGLPVSSLRTVGGLQDTDGDGLADVDEYRLGTNPFMYDTDADGLRDGQELKCNTHPSNPDTDNDGLPDGTEVRLGTPPPQSRHRPGRRSGRRRNRRGS